MATVCQEKPNGRCKVAEPIRREAPVADPSTARRGRYRWRICALLFFATTLNYLDRQVIGILAPELQSALRWTNADYANVVAAFKIAYAIGLVSMGDIMDRVGTRRGYAWGVGAWSIAGMLHAFADRSLALPRRAPRSASPKRQTFPPR